MYIGEHVDASHAGKDLVCVPPVDPTDLRTLCRKLRGSIQKSHSPTNNTTEYVAPPTKKNRVCESTTTTGDSHKSTKNPKQCNGSTNSSTDTVWSQIPEDAFDLLYKLLDFNPLSRITAALAVDHSFLATKP